MRVLSNKQDKSEGEAIHENNVLNLENPRLSNVLLISIEYVNYIGKV